MERHDAVITVHFHVPVPPLVGEDRFEAPHVSVEEWKPAKGFEVCTSGGSRVAIASVAMSSDAVVITYASDPGPDARVCYAMFGERNRMMKPFSGTCRWDLLQDSDPFKGANTGTA